ncbi:hypothetical protein GGR50DRAFT_590033 [Xylaria sp. CBS 124048]|nr:hypothetical protein GGR50DRAFT_590033 [Xylaria sp. CBS 124048]
MHSPRMCSCCGQQSNSMGRIMYSQASHCMRHWEYCDMFCIVDKRGCNSGECSYQGANEKGAWVPKTKGRPPLVIVRCSASYASNSVRNTPGKLINRDKKSNLNMGFRYCDECEGLTAAPSIGFTPYMPRQVFLGFAWIQALFGRLKKTKRLNSTYYRAAEADSSFTCRINSSTKWPVFTPIGWVFFPDSRSRRLGTPRWTLSIRIPMQQIYHLPQELWSISATVNQTWNRLLLARC